MFVFLRHISTYFNIYVLGCTSRKFLRVNTIVKKKTPQVTKICNDKKSRNVSHDENEWQKKNQEKNIKLNCWFFPKTHFQTIYCINFNDMCVCEYFMIPYNGFHVFNSGWATSWSDILRVCIIIIPWDVVC